MSKGKKAAEATHEEQTVETSAPVTEEAPAAEPTEAVEAPEPEASTEPAEGADAPEATGDEPLSEEQVARIKSAPLELLKEVAEQEMTPAAVRAVVLDEISQREHAAAFAEIARAKAAEEEAATKAVAYRRVRVKKARDRRTRDGFYVTVAEGSLFQLSERAALELDGFELDEVTVELGADLIGNPALRVVS